jgi:uncharacterized membrane protein YdbT with pleckstrin-like domain
LKTKQEIWRLVVSPREGAKKSHNEKKMLGDHVLRRRFILVLQTIFLVAFITVFAFYFPSLLLVWIILAVILATLFGSLSKMSMGIYYCPNGSCPYVDKLQKGKRCPKCGMEAQEFSIKQSIDLLKEKHKPRDKVDLRRTRKMRDEAKKQDS